MSTDELVRCPDAARRLGISTKGVYELLERGELEYSRDGDGWALIPSASLDRYLEARDHASRTQTS